jgi:histidinol-phosphate aminotransferase
MFDINNILRTNIKVLTPYSSARDEFKGTEGIFLDANENPFNTPYNRYPDPLQRKVKEKLAKLKGVQSDQIFIGNGSDEAIDLIIRGFCEPHRDNIVSISPSYGMYQVAADINAVEFKRIPLNDDFTLNLPAIKKAINENTHIVWLCSPNNPTANSFETDEVLSIANGFKGLLVVDEAYIDFSSKPSFIKQLSAYPNLVVLQTFSKAWGMAGLRMGLAYASKEIVDILNKIKYPYNVNILTQKLVLEALDKNGDKEEWVKAIIDERKYLIENLLTIKLVEKIFPSDANFILIKVKEPKKIYDYLVERQIVIRDRSKVHMCEGCLRITIGTNAENQAFYKALSEYKS